MAFRRILLLTAPLVLGHAQQTVPVGIVQGDLVSWSGEPKHGEITFRNAENRMYVCIFDERTYFERSKERITAAGLSRGDRVEVLVDHKDAGPQCYARMVQVVDGKRVKSKMAQSVTEIFAPRGDLTFAGVVLKVLPESLILRTRTHERRTILLRPDTRYLSDGQALERANLLVNTHVFIRAGRNYEDEVEAYQVIWGEILEPVIAPAMRLDQR